MRAVTGLTQFHPRKVGYRSEWQGYGEGMAKSSAPTAMDSALAEAIAVMIRALRLGLTSQARTLGLVALTTYAREHGGVSVSDLLDQGDLGDVSALTALQAEADEAAVLAEAINL